MPQPVQFFHTLCEEKGGSLDQAQKDVTITRCTFHWKASLTLTELQKAWPPTYGDATEMLMIGSGALIVSFNLSDDANFIANKVLSAPPKLRAAVQGGGKRMFR